jgi:hypothetical protein
VEASILVCTAEFNDAAFLFASNKLLYRVFVTVEKKLSLCMGRPAGLHADEYELPFAFSCSLGY